VTTREEHVETVQTWGEATCQDCGCSFPQRGGYERRCPFCYKLDKGYKVLWGDQAFLWSQQQALELQAQIAKLKALNRTANPPKGGGMPSELKGDLLRQVISLCHPDKHGNSEKSTKITQELNRLRGAAQKRKRARGKT